MHEVNRYVTEEPKIKNSLHPQFIFFLLLLLFKIPSDSSKVRGGRPIYTCNDMNQVAIQPKGP